MATANLHETVLSYKIRRNELNLEITNLQSQKTLGTYSQADLESLSSAEKREQREYFKDLYENDPELQEKYLDYTKIPDFDTEIDKIVANYQDQLDEMTAWETALDAQITTDSAELEEVNAYLESTKQMLSTNIQEDYNFGLNT
jgi:hypothetical protein